MERRDYTRYGVRALVDFEWMDEGVPQRGHGITRDISTKGMFIYSDVEPPEKADLCVNVFFRDVSPVPTKLSMRATGLVIRLEPATGFGEHRGFAILHRSYELFDGANPVRN